MIRLDGLVKLCKEDTKTQFVFWCSSMMAIVLFWSGLNDDFGIPKSLVAFPTVVFLITTFSLLLISREKLRDRFALIEDK